MKIAVIGGGSTYTPELIEGFARRSRVLAVEELVLQDVAADRLEIVGGLARRILARQGFAGRLVTTTSPDAAVDGAAAVLIQLRIGGQRARLVDETLPGRFGLLGQETTGPGGFAKGLRTIPVVLAIADLVARRARHDAWIVDFTNPVGMVTRALLDEGHRALGLCNVAIGLQRRLAARLGVDPDRVRLDHAGLNHLSWIRRVLVDGIDRLPEMLASDDIGDLVDAPAELMRTLGAIPSYYLHYFYRTDRATEARAGGPHRADEVLDIEQTLLKMYADPALDHKPALLDKRGGAYYSEAAAALATSLLTGDGAHHYVNVRNNGTIDGLSDETVVEVPATVDTAGAHPVPVAALAPEMLGLVQAVTAYEILTIEAARTGDRRVALRALLAHPLVRQWDIAVPLLDAVLDANRQHLPRFFARHPGTQPADA
ncbi:6-phospho-beta-glucosidase [Acrocarpospora macrocephala]|uniref:6-phospho-beta-glucosidase n=1 Tax=Acrocarpospora macrocephala TaxID=150177 RepID=A0A5M3WCJ4_9ACTN|nr:6-phospho-beta-glucosidase [Acrocarpospora macrocephala]GES06777.1 6-phospho-beta-glucosidase [Acrocarpospora macrocephala]